MARSPLLTTDRARAILAAMAGRRVVVMGDVALDEYLVGQAGRLSREAPVPVVSFSRRFAVPGSAANPARNISGLGAGATLIALVGADATAAELAALLRDDGIQAHLVVDPTRPTTLKTRIVAEGQSAPQQVARLDRQSREAAGADAMVELLAALEEGCVDADAVLVSHYRSGVVTPELAAAAGRLAKEHGLFLAVDAQGDLERFQGYDLVRVGGQDAARSLGRPLRDEADVEEAMLELLRRLGAGAVVLGRGSKGSSAALAGGEVFHLPPSNVSEVFDVTGAGDTVIAVLTLAMVSGANLREAAALANAAAGCVVRRMGVVAPSAAEIVAELGAVNP
jgi:rfaE bifunctional protein kinase chain/domain